MVSITNGSLGPCQTISLNHFVDSSQDISTHKTQVMILKNDQDLGIVLRCYFLGSSLKILPCGFFLMDRSVFFS